MSAASRSSARFARISWAEPITVFATTTPRKSASASSPSATVATPKNTSTAFGRLKRFARTMLA